MTCPFNPAKHVAHAPLCFCWPEIGYADHWGNAASVPEIDTGAGISAVLLLTLVILIVLDRRPRL